MVEGETDARVLAEMAKGRIWPKILDLAHVDALLASLATRYDVSYVRMTGLQLPYLDDHLHLMPAGHEAFGDYVAGQIAGLAG